MNISYITEAWPPSLDGTALAAARVVSHLRARGHGVELVRPRQHVDDAGDAGTFTLPAVSVPMLPGLRMGLPAGQRLARRWRATRPDVVHIATQGPLAWSACNAARELDIPVTSDFRTRFDSTATKGLKPIEPVLRAYLRGLHNRTACTFVSTDEMAGMLSGHGFRNLVVSGRAVDTMAYSPFYRSESLRRRWDAVGPVVLYAGDLEADCNLDMVVNTFEAIRAAEPTARLVFLGGGSLREELEERCAEAVFAGQQSGAMRSACYASADMLLLPSLAEHAGSTPAFADVTLQAMASGLPVVAYDAGAAASLIENEVNGMTVMPGDHFAFARAAVSLACDEPLRERLGAAATRTARTASWGNILADFERTLHTTWQRESAAAAQVCAA